MSSPKQFTTEELRAPLYDAKYLPYVFTFRGGDSRPASPQIAAISAEAAARQKKEICRRLRVSSCFSAALCAGSCPAALIWTRSSKGQGSHKLLCVADVNPV